nr:transporter substrate-binding domain-containing protein [Chromobacterium sphagni]
MVGDEYPPFMVRLAGGLSGPYADAFRLLMHQAGVEVQYQAVPAKRAFLDVSTQGDTCALAVNFDQGESETVNFVGVIAPITLTVYKRGGDKAAIGNLDALRKRRVGAVDIAEIRDFLGSAGMPFTPVKNSSTGFLMLNAGRFDALISDIPPSMDVGKEKPVRLFMLAQVERWLACNAGLPPAVQARMRLALKEGVFAEATLPVWSRYGMRDYYHEVRSSWLKGR